MSIILVALLALQLKHYVFDYLLQTPYQFSNKGSYGHPGGLIHAGLHALGSIPALLILAVPLGLLVALIVGEFVVHYHLDWAKEQVVRKFNFSENQQGYWAIFGADQLAHQLTYVAILVIATA